MKRQIASLLACLMILLLAGCRGQGGPSSAQTSAPPAEKTVTVENLTVELPRDLDTAAARKAMESLPALMAGSGVKIGEVSVTYGTSYAATAQALNAGGVKLAFLPAQDFVQFGGGAVPVLADARQALRVDSETPGDWNAETVQTKDGWTAGTFSLLCAAPTEYGKNLASRTEGGGTLTWTELDQARWGVLAKDSLAGYQCLELWLEDRYEDNGVEDLSHVTAYDSWEDLLRAAAEGKIDLFPLMPDLRQQYAALWTMEPTRTDESGARGFGRGEEIVKELPVVAVTQRLYQWVAAVTPGDAAVNGTQFCQALEQALEQAFSDPADRLAALGAEHYAPVQASDLNGLRRLMTGES